MARTERLTCLVFNDLQPWERASLEPILTRLSENQNLDVREVSSADRKFFGKNRTGNFWILSRNWFEALKFLAAQKHRAGHLYVSVLRGSTESRGLHTVLLKTLLPRLLKNVTLLVHSPLNYRFFKEIERIPETQIKLMPLRIFEENLNVKNAESRSQPHEKVEVGTFCEFNSESNINFFVSVAHYVCAASPSVHFRVMGTGPLYSHFSKMVDEMGLSGRVSIVETMTATDVGSLDLFLYTPLRNHHFLPIQMAAAFRIPVLSAELPGIEEFIRDGHNGFVVSVNEIKPMGELVLRLSGDAVLREELGKKFSSELQEDTQRQAALDSYTQLFFNREKSNTKVAEKAA